MKLSELLIEIQRSLQPNEVSQVMAALRQDALIWQTVEESELVSKMSGMMSQVEAWSPAFLALLSLGMDTKQIETLLENILSAPEDGLRNQAIQFYEETLRNGNNSSALTLAQACLLALALRERRRLTNSWIGVGKELLLNKKEAACIWKTAFACLVGMSPDFEVLATVLLKEANFEAAVDIISNALLSNPQSPAERVKAFLEVMKDLPVARQLSWLRLLNLRGFQTLVVQLADSLLQSDLTDQLSLDEVDLEGADLSALLQGSLSFQQLAGLYQLSGQPEKALPLLKRSQKAGQHYLAGINLQLLDVSAGEGSPEALMAVVQQSSAALPESKLLQSEYALAIDSNPHAGVLKKQLPLNTHNPFVELQNALNAAAEGDHVKAEVMARGAVADLLEWVNQDAVFSSTQFLYSWQPANFVKSLVDLGLLPEALKVTLAFLKVCPNNQDLIDLLSQLYDRTDDPANALSYSLLQLAFNANNQKTQRRVAELLEGQGAYKVALEHRRKVLELDKTPQTTDWLACAQCAFKSDDLLQVVDACNKVIKSQPENPAANSLMGQSLFRLGDSEASVPYLNQAVLLAPAEAQNWLMLSEIYEQTGDSQKVQETLNAAILSNPESAEINYKLAQIYLEKQNLGDALPFLQKAAGLLPESVQMSMQLGETLMSLGHLDEARQALEKARQKFPSDPNLALLTARTLMSMGDGKAALPALEVVMQAGKPGFDEYMMYLRALLGDYLFPLAPAGNDQERAKLLSAQNALEKALAINPDDFNARVLKAEVLAAKGAGEEAFENYQSLIDHPDALAPSWQWRIYGGFGKVALDLNEIETALAVLKEAAHSQPENVYLQRLLAEAYLVADLKDEAYQVAQNALKLAPTQLKNLAWFADMALHLGDEAEAINALKCIVELDPDSAVNWVKLADTQLKTGDVDGTRKTLKSLLSLDHLDVEHWRQAAYVFLRLNDQVSALSCLEQAIQLSPERAAELNFEVACLHKGLGNIDAALDALQNAIEMSPDERILYVMQADLMADLERNQAALACLEQALNLKDDHSSEQVKHFENALNQAMKLLPARWVEIASSDGGIHIRLARLLRRMGNMQDALEHAEKALESAPDMASYRYLAVDLAKTLLLEDKARRMLDWIESRQETALEAGAKAVEEQNPETWLALLCQWAEQILDTDEEVLAGRIVQQLIELAQDNARVMAAQARMLVRQGQVQVAEEVIEKVKQAVATAVTPLYDSGIYDYSGMQLVNECLKGRTVWYANALLDANNWQEALDSFEKAARNESDAQVNFEYARALVQVAEKQRLMSELKCVNHLPGAEMLTEENKNRFEKAIHLALSISNAPEAELWLLRGQVAFNPTPQNIHAFDIRLEHDGDVAPLVAALRQSNNLASALTVAQRLHGTPEDLLEGALCLQDGHPDKGLMLCQKALEIRPNNPVFNAAVALLSQKAVQPSKAFESLELALEAWPQEAEWHAWAAHLAKEVSADKFMPHIQKAYDLQPANVDYAYELGNAYLELGAADQAIEILQNATRETAERADVWSALCKAYEQTHKLEEAFQAAETASKLAPSSAVNLLACGKLAVKMGKADVAADYAGAAMDCAPKDEDVVVFASQVYSNQGHLQKSLSVIEKSLPNFNDSFKVSYEYARLKREMDGAEKSLPFVRDLAGKYPDQAAALALLAETEMDNEHEEEARRAAQETLKLDRQQPAILLLLGKLMRQSGQLDQAIDCMSESIQLYPEHMQAYLDLGETYQQRREPMQALHTYQQAIKVAPNEPALYYAAALVMRELKDYVGAEAMLRRAAELSPQDLNIRRQLGAVIALNLVHNSQEVNSQ